MKMDYHENCNEEISCLQRQVDILSATLLSIENVAEQMNILTDDDSAAQEFDSIKNKANRALSDSRRASY